MPQAYRNLSAVPGWGESWEQFYAAHPATKLGLALTISTTRFDHFKHLPLIAPRAIKHVDQQPDREIQLATYTLQSNPWNHQEYPGRQYVDVGLS